MTPLEPERTSDRIGEPQVTDHDIVESQRLAMTDSLYSLGLPELKVTDVVTREPDHYTHRPTLGLLSGTEQTTAFMVSAMLGSPERPDVDVLYIAPGSTGGSLKVDPTTGRAYADFFFEVIDGQMTPVRTTSPIPLDLVVPQYSQYDIERFDPEVVLADDKTHDITCYKGVAIPLFRDWGIPVPMGGVVDNVSFPSSSGAIDQLAAYSGVEGIVVKDAVAHRSTTTRLYDLTADHIDAAKAYAQEIVDHRGWVVIQERIIPATWPLSEKFISEKIDWIVRSIAVVNGLDVAYLGAFAEYDIFSNQPVSPRAHALPIRENSLLGINVRKFTEEGMLTVARGIQELGGNPQGILAFDMMLKGSPSSRTFKVLEPNGWLVGGMDELVRFHGPLTSVPERVLPILVPRLQQNFESRPPSADSFANLPITSEEALITARGLVSLHKQEAALGLLKSWAGNSNNPEIVKMTAELETQLSSA